jgi:hypothetical protein
VDKYHYLTPFYSPCVSASCAPGSNHLGVWFGHFPPWIPLGVLVLPFLLGFRLTCYYYRKAYYRSVWQSPPGCAVAEPHSRYTGETGVPLLFQNSHRYFFYLASVVSVINTYDAIMAFHSPSGFGFGLGNIILVVNVIMLWVYTISCHSCRHIVGGRLKDVDAGQQVEHPPHAVRLGHAGHLGADRLLRDAGRQRHHFRPEIHWLRI